MPSADGTTTLRCSNCDFVHDSTVAAERETCRICGSVLESVGDR